ncbi:hypothetical protein [Acidovorax radicis]|uniref:hypothetical protein n=1 Tax=Acidovorax radicis TaxID=758826 RepID=UPI001CF9187F|nr:hypothetical protein [Acidovorax radicis]UCU97281.1 hypothetical protein KI609_11670 [Acidovorax radicis]
MYLIVITWTYVTLMMAVAEATSPLGTVLGAIITFVLYGVLPMGIVVYILSTPARKRAIKAREAAAQAAHDAKKQEEEAALAEHALQDAKARAPTAPGEDAASVAPDAGGEAPAAPEGRVIAPVRKEP